VKVGDLVRLQPNFRRAFLKTQPSSDLCIVTRISIFGSIDVMLADNQVVVGVSRGYLEVISE
jgi:hypothetical protein